MASCGGGDSPGVGADCGAGILDGFEPDTGARRDRHGGKQQVEDLVLHSLHLSVEQNANSHNALCTNAPTLPERKTPQKQTGKPPHSPDGEFPSRVGEPAAAPGLAALAARGINPPRRGLRRQSPPVSNDSIHPPLRETGSPYSSPNRPVSSAKRTISRRFPSPSFAFARARQPSAVFGLRNIFSHARDPRPANPPTPSAPFAGSSPPPARKSRPGSFR